MLEEYVDREPLIDGAPNDFSGFVSKSYSALVRYGMALTADPGRAEDLVQSSLVKTLAAWPRLQQDAGAIAYTKVVMARAAWRAGRRRWVGEIPMGALPEAAGSDPALTAVEDVIMVRRVLAALPQAQRVVLVLRFLDGLSEAETATRLRCAPGTVKSRTARALLALRRTHLLEDEA